MCRLTGFWQQGGFSASDAKATAAAMAQRIAHRGPNESGVWVDADADLTLAFRRLSSLDLSPAGHQPMVSASGRVKRLLPSLLVLAFSCICYAQVSTPVRVLPADVNSVRGYSQYSQGNIVMRPSNLVHKGTELFYEKQSITASSSASNPMIGGQPLFTPNFTLLNAGIDGSPTTPDGWDVNPSAAGLFSAGTIPASTPSSPIISQFFAIEGIARVDSPGNYGVGLAGLGQCNAMTGSGAVCWGINPQVQARAGSVNSTMHGSEVDCENWGKNTHISGCLEINFYPESGGTFATNTVGLDLTTTPWPLTPTANNQFNRGIVLEPGFSQLGISLNPVANSASRNAQAIQFISYDATKKSVAVGIGGDANGSFEITTTPGGNLVLPTMGVGLQIMGISGNFDTLDTSNTTYRNQTLPDASGTIALISQLPPIRAGSWSISSSTSVAVTFSPAMSVAPSSCAVTPSASSAMTGTPFATALAATGFTVNVPTSGTLAGTYQCVVNNSN